MGPFLKRYFELLLAGALLAMTLTIYVAHAQKPAARGVLARSVVWLTSPMERAVVSAVTTSQDIWYGYVALRHTQEENLRLHREVLSLKADQARSQELEAENGRLRRMVSYNESTPDVPMLTAQVVAFSPDPRVRSIRIGRGASDGIRAGMPVVTPDGVVGRVRDVYRNTSDVLLIIDPTSGVAALSQRRRTRATARGLGDVSRLRLDFVARSDDIEEGDILVTAPSGGLFPKGLKLGRVTHVTESSAASYGLFKGAELIPAVDFDRLEEVEVVMDTATSAMLDEGTIGVQPSALGRAEGRSSASLQ